MSEHARKHRVLVGCPGPQMPWDIHVALSRCAKGNEVHEANFGSSWDNMNRLWTMALNAAANGAIDRFVMLHIGDVVPVEPDKWLQQLLDVMDETSADLVSAVIPQKDHTGITSSGIGHKTDPFNPWRRFTMREVMGWPETFNEATIGYEGWPLLHNNGCWVADMTRKVFTQPDADGCLPCFQFDSRICRTPDGKDWTYRGYSEDWHFSMDLWKRGVKSFITRRVKLVHKDGYCAYPNQVAWGSWKCGDVPTRSQWAPGPAEAAVSHVSEPDEPAAAHEVTVPEPVAAE